MTMSVSDADPTDAALRSQREDRRLRQLALNGDQQARERLIEKHLPLAAGLARRYDGRGEPLEDLVQVAGLALTKAAGRWDPRLGAFTTYAVPTILGELRRHFRDSTWLVRPPRALQEAYLEVASVRDALTQELGRGPSVDDVAHRLAISREVVLDACQAGRAYRAVSLDRPIESTESTTWMYGDVLADGRDDLSRCEDAVALSQVSAALTARDREVVRLRFHADMVQRDIAARVGCSQMQVSRILCDSLLRMRRAAEEAPVTE
jgi:RNA polymerase sigma-B factor